MKILASIHNTIDRQIYIVPHNLYDENSWLEVSVVGDRVEIKKHHDKLNVEMNDWNTIHQNILEAFISKLLDPDFRRLLL